VSVDSEAPTLWGPWAVTSDNPFWKILSFNINGFLGRNGTVGIDLMSADDAEKSWDRREGHIYEDSDISPEDRHSTVKIIHGRNGIGKTTFLNMIEEVGDLLRMSVPAWKRKTSDASLFKDSKTRAGNLFEREFKSIEISLAHDNPSGDYIIPDDFEREGDERIITIKISKIEFDKCDNGPNGELCFDGIKFCYDPDYFDSGCALVIEPINLDCSGRIAAIVGNQVRYWDIFDSDWLAHIETDNEKLPRPDWSNMDLGDDDGEFHIILENLKDERGDEFGWETQLDQLRNLDIIKLEVERTSVPVLDGFKTERWPIAPMVEMTEGAMKKRFDEWVDALDPTGANRGLLQLCWHWHSLELGRSYSIENFQTHYEREFVKSFQKYKSNPESIKNLDSGEIMWDRMENYFEHQKSLKGGLVRSASEWRRISVRNRYGPIDLKSACGKAHTLTCFFFYMRMAIIDEKRDMLINNINDRFEGKSLGYSKRSSGPPPLFESSSIEPSTSPTITMAELPIWIQDDESLETRKITELSSGEGNLLIMYFILNMYSDGRIVLIDEPENSMHPDWKTEFINDVKNITSRRSIQAIVATHSPSILGDHLQDTIELEIQQDES
jgi:ABC-type lipoprotein export system ATPase subunit